jgi:hypothetical protein
MPHPQHEQVRQAYDHRCGYYGVDENSAGCEFTVDHYQPRAASGTDDFDNLVYACHRCNQYKAITGRRRKKRRLVVSFFILTVMTPRHTSTITELLVNSKL